MNGVHGRIEDRYYPVGYLVAAAFTSGLVWLVAMLSQLPLR